MSARHTGRHVLAGLAGAALLLVQGPVATAADDLIDATPARVAIEAPAPGHSQEWQMSVVSVTDSAVPLQVRVEGAADRLFSGDHPLLLRIAEPGGRVLVEGPVADVLGRTVPLDPLPAGATYTLVGSVTLPAEAGNDYQGADGSLTVRFTATADSVADDPPADDPAADDSWDGALATTGATVGWVALAGLVLLAGGTTFLLLRRKSQA